MIDVPNPAQEQTLLRKLRDGYMKKQVQWEPDVQCSVCVNVCVGFEVLSNLYLYLVSPPNAMRIPVVSMENQNWQINLIHSH